MYAKREHLVDYQATSIDSRLVERGSVSLKLRLTRPAASDARLLPEVRALVGKWEGGAGRGAGQGGHRPAGHLPADKPRPPGPPPADHAVQIHCVL